MDYEFIVPEEYDGKKLLGFLRGGCGVSLAMIRSQKRVAGGITVDGEDAKTDRVVRSGERVALHVPQSGGTLAPCDAPVPVVYESAGAIVYDKPAGMATHPTRGYPDGTLANVYAARCAARGVNGTFRPLTRLDKNTSGLVLASAGRYGAAALLDSVRKTYLAVCEGVVAADAGEIDAPIARQPDSIIGRAVRADGAPSRTRYRVLARFAGYTLCEIETLTGRTHQIRVHFAHIGHPLAGDDLYGGRRDRIGRHALHCNRISFLDPLAQKAVTLTCGLPQDLRQLLRNLSAEDEAENDTSAANLKRQG